MPKFNAKVIFKNSRNDSIHTREVSIPYSKEETTDRYIIFCALMQLNNEGYDVSYFSAESVERL